MEPGQAALSTGGWIGALPNGVESLVFLSAEVPVSHRVSIDALVGLQRHAGGSLDARDALLTATWLPITRADLTVRIRPGLSIPTGGLASGLTFTPISTSSVDPWIAADVLVGTQWVGGLSTVTKVPLYKGWDKLRQGVFARADLRVARRLTNWMPMLGLSGVVQGPSTPVGAAPSFTELAATAAVILTPHRRWSVTAQGRVPLLTSATFVPSFGAAVRTVVGRVPEGHEH